MTRWWWRRAAPAAPAKTTAPGRCYDPCPNGACAHKGAVHTRGWCTECPCGNDINRDQAATRGLLGQPWDAGPHERAARGLYATPNVCMECEFLLVPPDRYTAPLRCQLNDDLDIDKPRTTRHPECPLTKDAP